ncbi:MAG: aminoacyl-tRNA hydrolase [Candidatus Atribacteria bacterium]|nr:aminoacyl-tRNA hydrolase [Candidatus Atribacteria bacterium]MCD6349826.1 aminoacyl-tRNA hydrolase [Candidatus Atribacteria bacterium]
MPHLVIGLGNPGKKYALTRHNVGFRVVDKIALKEKIHFSKTPFYSFSYFRIDAKEVFLIKPLTYMNQSGRAVQAFLEDRSLQVDDPQNIIVIHDEVDLPPGILRIKKGGGTAGHRGLNSLVEALNTQDFLRVRVGIGKPACKELMVDYVLGIPSDPQEISLLERAEQKAVEVTYCILREGVLRAMNIYNSKKEEPTEENSNARV